MFLFSETSGKSKNVTPGAESYVVLTFDSPGDKYSFLEKLGLEDETKYLTYSQLTEYFDYIY